LAHGIDCKDDAQMATMTSSTYNGITWESAITSNAGGSDKVIETRSLLFVLPLKDTMLARITRRIVSNFFETCITNLL
jgi:hypothetical protein